MINLFVINDVSYKTVTYESLGGLKIWSNYVTTSKKQIMFCIKGVVADWVNVNEGIQWILRLGTLVSETMYGLMGELNFVLTVIRGHDNNLKVKEIVSEDPNDIVW